MAQAPMLMPLIDETGIDPEIMRRQEEIYHNGPVTYNEDRAVFTCPRCGRDYSAVIRIFDGEVVRCCCGYAAA